MAAAVAIYRQWNLNVEENPLIAGTFQNLITEAFRTTWRIIDDGVKCLSRTPRRFRKKKPISILMLKL